MSDLYKEQFSLRKQVADASTRLTSLQNQRATVEAGLATCATRKQEQQPLLINGHAAEAQGVLDTLDSEERRLQRTLQALQVEEARATTERDRLQAKLNELDIRVMLQERAQHRAKLAAQLEKDTSIVARLQLELQAAEKRCVALRTELFALDKQTREEQQRVNMQQAHDNWRKAGNKTPGYERNTNAITI